VGKTRRLIGKDHMIVVSDAVLTREDSSQKHEGLLITVEVHAEGIKEAIPLARGLAASAADLLAMVHGTVISEPIPLFALSKDQSCGEIELLQVIRGVPELNEARRSFSDSLFRPILNRIDEFRKSDKKLAKRLDRALHYLRHSDLELDPIDKFEDLSNGLQSIEPGIRNKYHTPKVYTRTCSDCKSELVCNTCGAPSQAPDNFSGADYIIIQMLGRSEADARDVRNRRNAIVHSIAEFDTLLQGISELTIIARDALITGIYDLLELGNTTADGPSDITPPLKVVGDELVVLASLPGATYEDIKNRGVYPSIRLHGIEIAKSGADFDTAEPSRVVAVQLSVGVEGWEDEWELIEAIVPISSDAIQDVLEPDILLVKVGRAV
jgi:hypothetical protein